MKKRTVKPKEKLFNKSFEEIKHKLKTGTRKEIEYDLDHFEDQEWRSEEEKLQKTPILHTDDPDHGMPQTRRDFISSGIITSALTVSAPMVLPSIGKAANCPPAAAAAANIPLVVVDGSGGASYAGDNFIVGAANDPYNFLNDYSQMGVPTAQNPGNVAPVTPFGAGTMPFHPQSQLLAGIMATTSATTRANMDGTLICVETDDDTGNNQLNVSQALAQAGVTGELAGAIGTRNSAFGGRSSGPLDNAATRAITVADEASAAQLNNAGILETALGGNTQAVSRVVSGVASLTEAQSEFIAAQAAEQKIKDVVSCGAMANIDIIGGAAVEIQANASVQQVFGNNIGANETDEAVATGALLAIQGKVGVSTIEIGGCDYHNRGRPRQDAKDLEIGRAIGSAMELAALNNSPMAVYLISDGSTNSNQNVGQNSVMFEQRADNGRYAVYALLVFNPVAKPEVMKRQLGSYSANGVVPGDTPWAGSASTAASVIAANYLFLNNKIAEFAKLFPNPGFNVNDVIAFASKIK